MESMDNQLKIQRLCCVWDVVFWSLVNRWKTFHDQSRSHHEHSLCLNHSDDLIKLIVRESLNHPDLINH